jgi:hypothetical protein
LAFDSPSLDPSTDLSTTTSLDASFTVFRHHADAAGPPKKGGIGGSRSVGAAPYIVSPAQ